MSIYCIISSLAGSHEKIHTRLRPNRQKHTGRFRTIIVALLLASVLLPSLPAGRFLRGAVTGSSTDQWKRVLEQSRDLQRTTETLAAAAAAASARAKALEKQLQQLGRQKRGVRLEMADVLAQIDTVQNDAARKHAAQDAYKKMLAKFAKFLFTARLPDRSVALAGSVIGFSAGNPQPALTPAQQHDAAVVRAYEGVLALLQANMDGAAPSPEQARTAVRALETQLPGLRTHHGVLLAQYVQTLHALYSAEQQVAANAAQLRKAKAFAASVQQDLLDMQGEMARIDGRLRARAERELVQKGLMEDNPDRFAQRRERGIGEFVWPVSGRVTAGYRDPSYFAFFGIQHQGVDIAVPQGSAVAAAADGIVFTVRMGGARGYTYVLIGHRDGYATLYGHLSSVLVQAGDQVYQGQVIGLSGATPGTEGAGPMTTGPHLHVEMMRNGQRVDPLGVLSQS